MVWRERKAKGQMMVFEQVMLFMVGIVIFLVCVVSFSSYQSYFIQAGNDDQLEQVADYISYAITKLSGGWDGESRVTLDIPKTVGGESYRVSLRSDGVNVTMLPSMKYSFTRLSGIGQGIALAQSEALSTSGMVVLYKNGNEIIIQ